MRPEEGARTTPDDDAPLVRCVVGSVGDRAVLAGLGAAIASGAAWLSTEGATAWLWSAAAVLAAAAWIAWGHRTTFELDGDVVVERDWFGRVVAAGSLHDLTSVDRSTGFLAPVSVVLHFQRDGEVRIPQVSDTDEFLRDVGAGVRRWRPGVRMTGGAAAALGLDDGHGR